MKRITIIATGSVLISLAFAILFFVNWNAEIFFNFPKIPITLREIQQNPGTSFIGFSAGEDIPRLVGAEDFIEINFEIEYVTAEPVNIIATGVSSLKPWVSHYSTNTYKGRSTTKRPLKEIRTSGLDLLGNYLPYYLLELPNRTYILAQFPEKFVKEIKKGEHITLPIGQKVGMTDMTRKYLSNICREYEVDMSGVFYAFDNQWQGEHHTTLLLLRLGVASILWFVLAVSLIFVGEKVKKGIQK